MGWKVQQRSLFDQPGPDCVLVGERRRQLVLLVAEMIRQAACRRDPERKEGSDEQDHV